MTRGGSVLFLLLGLAAGCSPSPRSPAARAAGPLAVRVSGCRAIRLAPVNPSEGICEVERKGALRLWLDASPEASIGLRVDGREQPIETIVPARGGALASLHLPDSDVSALEVVATSAAGRLAGKVRLGPPEVLPGLETARSLRREGRTEEALAALDRLTGAGDARLRLQVLRMKARVARDAGHAEEAVSWFDAAIAMARNAGRISDENDDRIAELFLLLFDLRDLDRATRVLATIDQARLRTFYPDGAARVRYFQGLIAYESGDAAAAGRDFREAAEQSAALGLVSQEIDAKCLEADALVFMGRSREAVRLLDEALAAVDGRAYGCQRAHLLTNRGYSLVRMAPEERRSAAGRALDVMGPLLEAVELYEKPECRSPADLGNALTNVALGELDHSHFVAAQHFLERAKTTLAAPEVRVRAAWLEIEGHLALAAPGRGIDARRAFERLSTLAVAEHLPEAQLTAAAGRAEALERLGRTREALAAWRGVDLLLDETSRRLPIGEGRDSFLDRATRIAGLQVDFLLRARSASEAAAAARRSRARLVRSLAWLDQLAGLSREGRSRRDAALAEVARARGARLAGSTGAGSTPSRTTSQPEAELRYRAAVESVLAVAAPVLGEGELATPPEGELLLVYHPVRDGWGGFAVSAHGAIAARIGRIDPDEPADELASRLLGPFAPEIERARRVDVATSGVASDIDFHALPWKGRLLVEQCAVAWTLDLPRRSPPDDRNRSALLVADPQHRWSALEANPPAALREAEPELRVAAKLLQGSGWSIRRLSGPEASSASLRAALEAAPLGLFHYSGHSFLNPNPWDTGLPLAGGDWLTVADVTALARVPERVILSACQSASGPHQSMASGLGLAQSFILRGTAQAVATTRSIPDEAAMRVVAQMLGPDADARRLDLVEALARAQRTIARETPHGAWAAFRALVQ